MRISKLLSINIIKTLVFNFYYLPVNQAIKFPFRVGFRCRIKSLGKRKCVSIDPNKHIAIGLGQSFSLGGETYWDVRPDAIVIFRGGATFGRGTQFVVNGKIVIGDNFYCNADCIINVGNNIVIGDDNLWGWNVTVMDGDGHYISSGQSNNRKIKNEASISIGEHVWIGANSSLLKNTIIGSGSVVAMGTVISTGIQEENVVIGNNKRILKKDVIWKR